MKSFSFEKFVISVKTDVSNLQCHKFSLKQSNTFCFVRCQEALLLRCAVGQGRARTWLTVVFVPLRTDFAEMKVVFLEKNVLMFFFSSRFVWGRSVWSRFVLRHLNLSSGRRQGRSRRRRRGEAEVNNQTHTRKRSRSRGSSRNKTQQQEHTCCRGLHLH